jgi:mycofactocin system glycosyltransferase
VTPTPTPTPTPYPTGIGIAVDASTREVAAGTLVGGSPRRMLRLSRLGRHAWHELREGMVSSPAAGVLARRLTDAGLAHPRPARLEAVDVTIIVPVHNRAALLDRCLAALGSEHPVIVVDDASTDAAAIAAVASEYGARVIRRDVNGGPAAARNAGLTAVATEYVAFIDSDCVPSAGWIGTLAGHFRDPLVAAVAPRVVPVNPTSSYLGGVGSLDLGRREGRVRALSRLGYVPTAALVVRLAALDSMDSMDSLAAGFDTSLRYGEDVDLIWRFDAAGWRVRYDPAVRVGHHEPASWRERVAKRFAYGSSAAPLALRHPGAVPPMVVAGWPMTAVAGALARRPVVVAAGLAGSAVAAARGLDRAGLPQTSAPVVGARAAAASWVATGRVATQFGVPIVALAARRRRHDTRRTARGRRFALAALVTAPALASWRSRRPSPTAIPVARYVAGHLLDDIAYGAGVYAGCVRERTLAPLRPVRTATTEVS